jgi:hypothetical protein
MTKPTIPDPPAVEPDSSGVKVEWNPGSKTWNVLCPGLGWSSHRSEAVARHRARYFREMLRTCPADVEPEPDGLDASDPPDPAEWRPPYTVEISWCEPASYSVIDRDRKYVQAGLALDHAERLAPHLNSRASDAFAAVGITVEWDPGSSMWCVRKPNEGWGYYCGHAEAWHKAAELYREIRSRPAPEPPTSFRSRELDGIGPLHDPHRSAIAAERQADRDVEAAHPVPTAVRPTPLPREDLTVRRAGDLWAVCLPGQTIPALFHHEKMAHQYANKKRSQRAEADGKGVARVG